jgi:hypothetical protein
VLLELDLSLEIVIADSSLTLSLEIVMASCTFTSSHCCSYLTDWRCLCCGNGSLLGIMRPAVAGFAVCWVIRETGTGIRDGRSRERVLPRLVRSLLRIVRADLQGIQIEPGGEEPSGVGEPGGDEPRGGERWRRWWGEDSRLRFFLAWAGVSAGMLEIATTSFGSFLTGTGELGIVMTSFGSFLTTTGELGIVMMSSSSHTDSFLTAAVRLRGSGSRVMIMRAAVVVSPVAPWTR